LILNIVRPSWLFKCYLVILFSPGKVFWFWSAFVMSSIGICEAGLLNQTNFENGKMSPWEHFVTPNGTLGWTGLPTVVLFETVTDGQVSKSLQFKVGQIRYDPDNETEQGGGLAIQITTETGTLNLSAYVAATYHSPKDKRNLAGGLFQWVVDEQVIASHDIGPIEKGGILRHRLNAHHSVNAGIHTIRLRITRPFTSHPGQDAPFQYVDDLLIRLLPNP
jgi:hypothetical protein